MGVQKSTHITMLVGNDPVYHDATNPLTSNLQIHIYQHPSVPPLQKDQEVHPYVTCVHTKDQSFTSNMSQDHMDEDET